MEALAFNFNDGGRTAAGYKGDTGDCVTRSIAIATGQPYQVVYDALNNLSKSERRTQRRRVKSHARTGVRRPIYETYLKSLGWEWFATMGIGTGCKVHLVADELPAIGTLIVAVSRHLTCIIDGVINDTHDPQREMHNIARDDGRVLKPGEWRNQNGICSISRRCVYGYYKKPRQLCPVCQDGNCETKSMECGK